MRGTHPAFFTNQGPAGGKAARLASTIDRKTVQRIIDLRSQGLGTGNPGRLPQPASWSTSSRLLKWTGEHGIPNARSMTLPNSLRVGHGRSVDKMARAYD